MTARELLYTVYSEIGVLESLWRQKAMILEDNSGLKAIRYDSEKVCGGRQTDLSEVMVRIEQQEARAQDIINRQIERIMEHRAKAYEILENVPESVGKAALQEHYLYHVPWGTIGTNMHYNKDSVRRLAYGVMDSLDEETCPVLHSEEMVK